MKFYYCSKCVQNLVFVRVSIVSDTELSIKKSTHVYSYIYSVLNLIVVVFSSEFVNSLSFRELCIFRIHYLFDIFCLELFGLCM